MPYDLMPLARLAMMLVACAALVAYRRDIQDALERFNRRGPRPPSSPVPANDAFLLRGKRSKRES